MKILYITTVSNTIEFFPEHIKMLQSEGHAVDLACNMQKPFSSQLCVLGCKVYNIPFSRSPLNINNLRAYIKLKKLLYKENYKIIHTHTPIASFYSRLVARSLRKKGLVVFYTAHGFHFYKGAPLKNWLLYYPVEKLCSRWTDVLITINKEDYALACKKMKARRVEYVPGVGIDVAKFKNTVVDKQEKRRKIGVPDDAFVLLSVGELNANKNHEVVIRAIAQIKHPDIHYAIAGRGDKHDYLINLANELGIAEQLHLLGYRNDVAELYKMVDAYVHPSFREGLPVSIMEAMVSGLPVICSKIRGNVDLIDENGKNGFVCEFNDSKSFANAISNLYKDFELRLKMGTLNENKAKSFDIELINQLMKNIYNKY